MNKLHHILWLGVIAVAAFGLYMVKYEVQELHDQIATIKTQLDEERQNVHVATAEWAYLTRPDRLQTLVQKHTQLMPIQSLQIGQTSHLPFPLAPADGTTATLAHFKMKE